VRMKAEEKDREEDSRTSIENRIATQCNKYREACAMNISKGQRGLFTALRKGARLLETGRPMRDGSVSGERQVVYGAPL